MFSYLYSFNPVSLSLYYQSFYWRICLHFFLPLYLSQLYWRIYLGFFFITVCCNILTVPFLFWTAGIFALTLCEICWRRTAWLSGPFPPFSSSCWPQSIGLHQVGLLTPVWGRWKVPNPLLLLKRNSLISFDSFARCILFNIFITNSYCVNVLCSACLIEAA